MSRLSKSKVKPIREASKEQPKVSSRSLAVLEPMDPVRSQTTDELEHARSSSNGTLDVDSLSNTGSCSGESDDPKEKMTHSAVSDSDKRDKNRQKNERKHQRQRERRAQELHERCREYLMSRKLEVHTHQLMAMGFTSEQATMALIQNKGHVEESVMWLLEGGAEIVLVIPDLPPSSSLEIDIDEELARILEIEMELSCTKQEIQRALVSCQGDLVKAEEFLRTHRREPTASIEEPEEVLDPVSVYRDQAISERPQERESQHLKREERDRHYPSKPLAGGVQATAVAREEPLAGGPQATAVAREESGSRSLLQPSKVSLAKQDRPRQLNTPSNKIPVPASDNKVRLLSRHTGLTGASLSPLPPASTSLTVHAKTETKYPTVVSQVKRMPRERPTALPLPVTSNGSTNATSGSSSLSQHSSSELAIFNSHRGSDPTTLGFGSDRSFVRKNPQMPAIARPGSSVGAASSSSSVPYSLPAFAARQWSSFSPTSALSMQYDYTAVDWTMDTRLLEPTIRNLCLTDTWSTMFMGGRVATSAGNGSDGSGISSLGFMEATWEDLWEPRSTLTSPSI